MTVKAKMDASPPGVTTPELLDALRSQSDLPGDVWYLVVVTALCVLNRPEDIPAVYTHAVRRGHGGNGLLQQDGAEVAGEEQEEEEQEQLRIVRRMREALLKTSAIAGLPKVRACVRAGAR